ncbi:MAG: hypothetical protein ACYC8T_31600 [Myxococcaceae bacterium]
MDCQIETAPQALETPSTLERLWIRLLKRGARLASAVLRRVHPRQRSAPISVALPRLDLRPGERIRVRSREEIRATLDSDGRFQGLAYVPAMDRYCQRTFVVRKRIGFFFDERTRRLLKPKDVVILDGSFCEPALSSHVDYGGCDRSCFLFWKEAWLERLPPS